MVIQLIKQVRNYLILFCLAWISVHIFYYVSYPQRGGYPLFRLIAFSFQRDVGVYSIAIFFIFVFLAVTLLHRYSKMIVDRAVKKAGRIKKNAEAEVKNIKEELARQAEALKGERNRLESEYKRI